MDQNSIELIANQLSKITNKLEYQFNEDYYKNIDEYFLNRDLNIFFDDAVQHLQICELPDLGHKEFLLTFKSLEIRNLAISILKSHDYLWDDEFNVIDSCKLYVHTYDISAYDFIFGRNRSRFSINQLSIILNTEIAYEYSYPNVNSSKLKFDQCIYYNGNFKFDCEMTFKEVRNIEDIYEFNKSLYIFIDLVDDLEIAKTINLKIFNY